MRCVEWASKAAAGGDRRGQFRLGHAYHFGLGVPGAKANWNLAVKWCASVTPSHRPSRFVDLHLHHLSSSPPSPIDTDRFLHTTK